MSTDAIVVLKDEHKEIRKLFRDFQGAAPTPQPPRERSRQRSSRS